MIADQLQVSRVGMSGSRELQRAQEPLPAWYLGLINLQPSQSTPAIGFQMIDGNLILEDREFRGLKRVKAPFMGDPESPMIAGFHEVQILIHFHMRQGAWSGSTLPISGDPTGR
jgi:hypothetical protein